MKLKNIGSKIINVGSIVLMPDEDIPVEASVAELPSIKAIVKAGFLSIEKSDSKPVDTPKKNEETSDKEENAEKAENGKKTDDTIKKNAGVAKTTAK